MNNQTCKEFLVWLQSRLKLKYNEDPDVLKRIQYIIDHKKIIDERVSVNFINGICNRHYPGFDFEKTPDFSMGYGDEEKKRIYSFVSSIIVDTINAQQ
jgi:hypothetical protein